MSVLKKLNRTSKGFALRMGRTQQVAALAVLLGAVAVGANVPHALARGGSTMVGTSWFGSQRHCFQENWTGISNVCTQRQAWVMPAVYDNAGWMNLQVSARGVQGTARRVCCVATSVNSSAGAVRQGAWDCTELHTGASEWLRSSLDAHGWGSTTMRCELDSGTAVHAFHY